MTEVSPDCNLCDSHLGAISHYMAFATWPDPTEPDIFIHTCDSVNNVCKNPWLRCTCESGSTGTSWKSVLFPKLPSGPLEMCLIDPVSVIFTPRRFKAFSDMTVNIAEQHLPNPALVKTSASISFVRTIYFLSSTTEV